MSAQLKYPFSSKVPIYLLIIRLSLACWVLILTVIHDNIGAFIYEGMKDSN